MFNVRLFRSWIFVVPLLIFSACENPEDINEIKNGGEEIVKTLPNTYDNSGTAIPNQYIVLLKSDEEILAFPTTQLDRKNDSSSGDLATQHRKIALPNEDYPFLSKYGLGKKDILETYEGFAPGLLMNMDAETAAALSQDPQVEIVEQDKIIALSVAPLVKTPFLPSNEGKKSEVRTYGVQRVGGSVDFSKSSDWNKRWAWIMDSGIDYDHPDLYVNTKYSVDFTGSIHSFDDKLGHGTHVAGIIGAKSNSFGVEGVAAGAVLLAVKVLDDKGEGTISSVLHGLCHIYLRGMRDDVVNISLGGTDSGIIAFGINLLSRLGARVVVAAGNSGQDANSVSPANINNPRVYTVGAIDWNDSFTSYSNYGSALDFVAPGEGILSTYLDGKYAYMGGTSMAAPHVTGIMLLNSGNYSTSGQVWGRDRYLPVASH